MTSVETTRVDGISVPIPDSRNSRSARWQAVRRLVLGGVAQCDPAAPADADHGVILVRFAEPVGDELLARMVDDCGACDLPASPAGTGMVLVVPEHRTDHADRKLAQMAAMSGNRMWTATATRPMTEVTSAYQEAKDILTLVLAARRPPGHYRLDDVLMEYAIARDPVVSRRLVAIVQPLLAGKVLLETLEALIAAGFDRGTTARTLFIHRSTLDYRIRRIAELTGHCPASSRGAHLLTAAMTAHNVAAGLFWFDEKMPGKVLGNR